jgi:hypothetical protein
MTERLIERASAIFTARSAATPPTKTVLHNEATAALFGGLGLPWSIKRTSIRFGAPSPNAS